MIFFLNKLSTLNSGMYVGGEVGNQGGPLQGTDLEPLNLLD